MGIVEENGPEDIITITQVASCNSVKLPLSTYTGTAYSESTTLPLTTAPAWWSQWSFGSRLRILTLLTGYSFLVSGIGPAYYPCVVPIEDEFNDPLPWEMGLSNYIFLFVTSIMVGFWACLSDRFTRKWILFFCSCFASLFLILSAGTNNIISLIAFRAATAVMTSATFPVSRRIIGDIIAPSSRGRTIFVVMFNQILVLLFIPLLAGIVVEYIGWRYVFLIQSSIFAVFAVLTLFLIPETMDKEKKKWSHPLGSVWLLFTNFELFSIVLMIAIETACIYFMYLLIALYFPEDFSLKPVQIGGCYMLLGICYLFGGLLGSVFAKLIQKRLDFAGRMLLPIISFLILAACNFLVGWSISQIDFWITFSFILACAGLRGFILPGAVSYCIELQTRDAKSILEGLSTAQIFMSFLAQMIGTLFATELSFTITFSIISGLMVLSSIPVTFFIAKRIISSLCCR